MRDLIKFRSVDQYLQYQPQSVAKLLSQLRDTIIKAAPDAQEVISYNMPAYKLEGSLVYFAAYDKHIGFYPTPSGIEKFSKELTKYTTSKGTVQFALDQPLPLTLIRKIVKFRVQENLEKVQLKKELLKSRR